jgi:hypothetical protein
VVRIDLLQQRKQHLADPLEIPAALTTSADSSICLQKVAFQQRQRGQTEFFFVVNGVVFYSR